MNLKEFLVTEDVKEITRTHSLERIKYEFDRFGLDKEKRIQMIELGTLGQLIFKQYLDQEGLIYDFEFQAGNYDDKDFQVWESIVEIKTSGYSEKDGYSNLNAIYNHNQMQHAERKNISLDTNDFDISFARGLTLEDGAATLTAFTAKIITSKISFFLREYNNKKIN